MRDTFSSCIPITDLQDSESPKQRRSDFSYFLSFFFSIINHIHTIENVCLRICTVCMYSTDVTGLVNLLYIVLQ